MERAPCSPSDALLKVKVFRPSVSEEERQRAEKGEVEKKSEIDGERAGDGEKRQME